MSRNSQSVELFRGAFLSDPTTLQIPLVIDFACPSSLLREPDRPSDLTIVGNGPPGTFILFPDRLRVSLPTDQIVLAEEADGHVRVGFGGMRFVAEEGGKLVFVRFRELFPEAQLSPARSQTMYLESHWVAGVSANGVAVWPPKHHPA